MSQTRAFLSVRSVLGEVLGSWTTCYFYPPGNKLDCFAKVYRCRLATWLGSRDTRTGPAYGYDGRGSGPPEVCSPLVDFEGPVPYHDLRSLPESSYRRTQVSFPFGNT